MPLPDGNKSLSRVARFGILLVCLIALATLPSSTYASSQPTTSISALNYPSNAATGSQVTVSFRVKYSTNEMVWLMTAISCGPNETDCNAVSVTAATSSPLSCDSVNPFGDQYPLISASCYLTATSNGSESFSYAVSFSQPGTYQLITSSHLNYPWDQSNISGSWNASPVITITVS